MTKIVVVVAEERRLRSRFIPNMLHRNGGECALLVRLSGEVLPITPVNQGFIVLARGLRSEVITAIFRQRGWADGDDAMR